MDSLTHSELGVNPAWHRTGNAKFPAAAEVGGDWWVLRLNNFPDHDMWTLFINGNSRRFDLNDTPAAWDHALSRALPQLSELDSAAALAGIADFVAYGSEVGRPCDNGFCCG